LPSALIQHLPQGQKRRMPLGQTVIGQAIVRAIVAEVVEKALLHIGSFRVGVDVPQRIQPAAKAFTPFVG